MAQPKLSLVDSGIIDGETIEDAIFEGDFHMSTAREEMRDGFASTNEALRNLEGRMKTVEDQMKEAAEKLQTVHDERTALRAVVRFASWLGGGLLLVVGAAWAVYTRWPE